MYFSLYLNLIGSFPNVLFTHEFCVLLPDPVAIKSDTPRLISGRIITCCRGCDQFSCRPYFVDRCILILSTRTVISRYDLSHAQS